MVQQEEWEGDGGEEKRRKRRRRDKNDKKHRKIGKTRERVKEKRRRRRRRKGYGEKKRRGGQKQETKNSRESERGEKGETEEDREKERRESGTHVGRDAPKTTRNVDLRHGGGSRAEPAAPVHKLAHLGVSQGDFCHLRLHRRWGGGERKALFSPVEGTGHKKRRRTSFSDEGL